jgi:glycosyltransferase involved in cell wall biosynthesis
LFRDFAEDRRVSMEVYADQLVAGVTRECSEDWQIDPYVPRIPGAIAALPIDDHQRLRLARFLGYPWQALRRRGDLNHVIDHGYGHLTLVLGAGRTVVTVHDLIPFLRWKGAIPGVAPDRRHPLVELSLHALKRAGHLIADSENTKRDIIRHLGCDPDRITVIPLGIDPSLKPCRAEERGGLRDGLGLPNDGTRLVLSTGSSFYKNGETSLAVVKNLQVSCSQPVLLVHLGPITPAWRRKVASAGMSERVVELAEVPRMWELYNAVDCLLFPSWYEGLGLPPLEAMACGTPAVTSNAGALPETVGDAALMAAPDDIRSLAEAVRLMLEDAVARREQIAKGLCHARKFTWARNTHETLRVYERLLEGGMTNRLRKKPFDALSGLSNHTL